MNRLGTKIKTLREKQKLSLRGLAQKASISAGYLCQIEKGERQPAIIVLSRLAQSIGEKMIIREKLKLFSTFVDMDLSDRLKQLRQKQKTTKENFDETVSGNC